MGVVNRAMVSLLFSLSFFFSLSMYLSLYHAISLSLSLCVYLLFPPLSIYVSLFLSFFLSCSLYPCIYLSIILFLLLSLYVSIYYFPLYVSIILSHSLSLSIYVSVFHSLASTSVTAWLLPALPPRPPPHIASLRSVALHCVALATRCNCIERTRLHRNRARGPMLVSCSKERSFVLPSRLPYTRATGLTSSVCPDALLEYSDICSDTCSCVC